MARAMVTRRRGTSTPLPDDERAAAVEETTEAEEDTTPKTRRSSRSSRVAEQAKAGAGGGWGAYGKVKEAAKKSSFNSEDQLKIEDEEPHLIKFVEDSPFESYYQHWVQRGKGKKRSWTCPGEDTCPLCSLGHPVRCLTLFNVIEIDGDKHSNKFWVCGKNAGDQVEEMALSKRYSPINDDDLYFEVKRKEAEFGFKYTLNPLRESELDDVEVVSDEELDAFLKNLFESGPNTVEPVDMAGLEECADEVVKKGDK
jgi:hypothetical protein